MSDSRSELVPRWQGDVGLHDNDGPVTTTAPRRNGYLPDSLPRGLAPVPLYPHPSPPASYPPLPLPVAGSSSSSSSGDSSCMQGYARPEDDRMPLQPCCHHQHRGWHGNRLPALPPPYPGEAGRAPADFQGLTQVYIHPDNPAQGTVVSPEQELFHLKERVAHFRRRVWCCLAPLLILCCLLTLGCVSMVTMLYFLGSEFSSLRPDHAQSSLEFGKECVPCDALKHTFGYDLTPDFFDRRHDANQEMCCPRNSTEFLLMLRWVMEKKLQEENNHDKSRSAQSQVGSPPGGSVVAPRAVAAHLVLEPSAKKTELDGSVRWSFATGVGFKQGLNYDGTENSLVVPEDGVYFIYAQLAFRQDGTQENTPSWTVSLQHMAKQSPPAELWKNMRTRETKGVSGYQYSSIYVAGAHNLFKGDKVLVKGSPISTLHRDGTFFGMFKV